jgi:hypothetical protein
VHLVFDETFSITPAEAYDFCKTPADWPRRFGAFTNVTDRGNGWYAVWIRRTPIPLIAKITVDEPEQQLAWDFRGLWRGDGAVQFEATTLGTRITGHETIAVPRPLRFIERFLEPGFAAVWEGGWRRLRKPARKSR